MENSKNTFGDKIVQGRKKKGMSQEAFANAMGVSRQIVSRWELNTAMPRMQKIKKISEILDISIEELLSGSENKKIISPVASSSFNLKTFLKGIVVILAIMLILYVAYSTYKIIILNKISSKLEQYKNLDNYYFKLESYIDGELQEANEVWYKDGKYKLIETDIINSVTSKTVTYLDLNNSNRYIVNEENESYNEVKLYRNEKYVNGSYMYNLFPTIIKAKITNFKNIALKLDRVWAYYKGESLFIDINNETIELNKITYIPQKHIIKMQENKNSQIDLFTYIVNINSVEDKEVSVPPSYKKVN